MSTERPSLDFSSVIPQAYRSRAEAFARCLHDKLISLGGVAGLTGSMRECDGSREDGFAEPDVGHSGAFPCGDGGRVCSCSEDEETRGVAGSELDDMDDYDVPYRVLRESSSTSDLEKHFSSNLHSTKRFSKSGDSLTERLTGEKEDGEAGAAVPGNVPAIRVTGMDGLETDSQVKLRRCSSLKTWKTPPGTPGEKKIVRFADALGLDLADVRTFLDEIPKIPSSAYVDLEFSDGYPPPPCNPTLIPRFVQPATQLDFAERVRDGCVCLESATLTDTAVLTVSGCIRVRNVTYEKSVHVRYTKDNWTTFSDLQATYIPNSCDGFSDRFSFVLYGHTLKIGERLEFAIRLECSGAQYWDNNGGRNYIFECLPQSPSTSQLTEVPLSASDTWSGFY